MTSRKGHDGATQFFTTLGQYKFNALEIRSLMSGGNQVAVDLLVDISLPEDGRFRDEEIHLWTFNEDGKVVRFRHYIDTAKHIAAARGAYTTMAAGAGA